MYAMNEVWVQATAGLIHFWTGTLMAGLVKSSRSLVLLTRRRPDPESKSLPVILNEAQHLYWEGEDDGRVLLGGNVGQRLQVPQLQRRR